MNVNFAFLRHGYACHNAIRPLYNNNIISREDYNNVLGITADPELTQLGVDASAQNGCIISKIIKHIHKVENDTKLNMETINVVGTSPLIRCMETAYYMTRNWKNPPSKIYVFPFLREIDESSDDIYSDASRQRIDIIPSYAMKSIDEQKAYLEKQGILQYFDFSFVEDNLILRKEPGNIYVFINWFAKNVMPQIDQSVLTKNLNVFVTTHAGVLKHFSHTGFHNNSGFIQNTFMYGKGNVVFGRTVSFNRYLPQIFFNDYSNAQYNKRYYCPSNRCGTLCANDTSETKRIKRIKNQCKSKPSDTITFTNS